MAYVVLIVDDDPRSMKLTYDLLNVFGYTTIQATDGKRAVELAVSQQPDLIIMDIQLPVMDGFEAAKVIKLDPVAKNIPIIAATAYAMKGDEEKALQAGCNGYLTKPINIKELINTVEKYSGRSNNPNYVNNLNRSSFDEKQKG